MQNPNIISKEFAENTYSVEKGAVLENGTVIASKNEVNNAVENILIELAVNVQAARLNEGKIFFGGANEHNEVYSKVNDYFRNLLLSKSFLNNVPENENEENKTIREEKLLSFADISGKELFEISNVLIIDAVQKMRIELAKATN